VGDIRRYHGRLLEPPSRVAIIERLDNGRVIRGISARLVVNAYRRVGARGER
jgi:hypothetical protein